MHMYGPVKIPVTFSDSFMYSEKKHSVHCSSYLWIHTFMTAKKYFSICLLQGAEWHLSFTAHNSFYLYVLKTPAIKLILRATRIDYI